MPIAVMRPKGTGFLPGIVLTEFVINALYPTMRIDKFIYPFPVVVKETSDIGLGMLDNSYDIKVISKIM